jgi:hypothetical protein
MRNAKAKPKVAKYPYKAYKFKHGDRVKGPGMDIGILCACAGCYALYMNLAYNEGYKNARRKTIRPGK